MTTKIDAETEAFLQSSLDDRLSQLNDKQKARFALCYPLGVPAEKMREAIRLCDRTIAANNGLDWRTGDVALSRRTNDD